MESLYVVGVDLGGSNVRALLADAGGQPVAERAKATAGGDARAVLSQVADLCRGLARDAGVDWERIAGAAVGVPGVAHSGTLLLAPNLPPFDDVDFAGALSDELGVAVTVDNDVNVATLAEWRKGHAIGLEDFAFIAIGTGIGMGIVAGGRLQRGSRGAAGEISALPLGADPFDPANHVHGALEEVAGGVGVARRYTERTGVVVTALDVFDAAAAGDENAHAVVDEHARAVALATIAVQSVLDPQLIVYGGGIGSRPDVLDRVHAYVALLTQRPPKLAASALGERAGAIGAAELARASANGGANA
ncbi:MAG: hypothetical protein QOF43_1552 [Gaiellaceae bacterium]|nr:hypothetical protein [Gaiellaceae bacterium]